MHRAVAGISQLIFFIAVVSLHWNIRFRFLESTVQSVFPRKDAMTVIEKKAAFIGVRKRNLTNAKSIWKKSVVTSSLLSSSLVSLPVKESIRRSRQSCPISRLMS